MMHSDYAVEAVAVSPEGIVVLETEKISEVSCENTIGRLLLVHFVVVVEGDKLLKLAAQFFLRESSLVRLLLVRVQEVTAASLSV